jgi:carbon starvation protein CstA
MNPRRLDAGAVVAALGGLLLLVSLFLDWYGDGGGDAVSAFTVFETIDLVLAAIALLAICTCLSRAGVERRLPDAPLLVLGALAILIVVSQLLNDPPRLAGLDPELETGAWLALAGAAILLAGAFMSVARVSLAVSVEQRERPGPDVRPAAPAGSDSETVRLRSPDQPG